MTSQAFAWVSKSDKSATRGSGNTFELSSLISVCDVVEATNGVAGGSAAPVTASEPIDILSQVEHLGIFGWAEQAQFWRNGKGRKTGGMRAFRGGLTAALIKVMVFFSTDSARLFVNEHFAAREEWLAACH